MNLKEKLKAGQKVYGTMVRIERNPAFCIIAKECGLDFIMFDCEHAAYNLETLHDLFMMSNAIDLTAVLRVPQLDKESISRALDAGAKGCMIPMCETPEQAREIVHWSKYPPIGDRGYGSGIASSYYKTGLTTTDAMGQINDTVIAIAQIETGLAVENVDEIAATEGIDALIVGPNDLSITLGIPGKVTDGKEIEAIRKVAAACRKYGKAFGIHGPDSLQRMFADEINLVIYSTDADVMRKGMKDLKEKMVGFQTE